MDENYKHLEVEFRYVGVPADNCEIPGICFCYPDRTGALELYKNIHDYLMAQTGEKSMKVEFVKTSKDSYTLNMNLSLPDKSVQTSISSIDAAHIYKIREGLKRVAYYIIFAGYLEDDNFELLEPSEYHMFKRDIVIDGNMIIGTAKCDIDWNSIFD